MQAFFGNDEVAIAAFRATISEARFARYLKVSSGDVNLAVNLYHWNALLSQSFYLPLQVWEVALRNKLNHFLIQRYGNRWPTEPRVERELRGNEKRRLNETLQRLDPKSTAVEISTNAVVADLSAGFWVALLGSSYETPFAWRYKLAEIFPHLDVLNRASVSQTCAELLVLRNRVAHHEPIFHMDLPARKRDLAWLTQGLCASSHLYIDATCTFAKVWKSRPQIRVANDAHAPDDALPGKIPVRPAET